MELLIALELDGEYSIEPLLISEERSVELEPFRPIEANFNNSLVWSVEPLRGFSLKLLFSDEPLLLFEEFCSNTEPLRAEVGPIKVDM